MGELMGRSMDWLVSCLVATYGAGAWIYGLPGGKMTAVILMGRSMDWLVSCLVSTGCCRDLRVAGWEDEGING